MKGRGFGHRLGFALAGLRAAFARERSFRTQVGAAGATLLATLYVAPSPLWWALVLLCVALVLAAELINSALESVLDGLHPDQAEFVRIAKDCAAGAVLVLSLAAVAVFGLMLAATLA